MHPETQKTGCLLFQLLGLGSLDGPVHFSQSAIKFPFLFLVGFVFSFSSFVFGNSSQDTAMNTVNLFLSAADSLPSLSFSAT